LNRKAITISNAILLTIGVLVLVGVSAYWWNHRRIQLYGGVKPFMETMQKSFDGTAAELGRAQQKLPEDFRDMEQLGQDAQDIVPVFRGEPRERDPRFGSLAAELMRRGTMLETAWDNKTPADATKAFADLAKACNACHQQLAPTVAVISGEPKR
jgi:hypothetical protein